MTTKITVPDIGDFENVEIIEVLAKPGDLINKNDPVVTLESDKSSVEVPSPFAGTITSLEVKIGDKVSKGTVLAIIEDKKSEDKSNELKKEKIETSKIKEEEILPDTENTILGLFFLFSFSFGTILSMSIIAFTLSFPFSFIKNSNRVKDIFISITGLLSIILGLGLLSDIILKTNLTKFLWY